MPEMEVLQVLDDDVGAWGVAHKATHESCLCMERCALQEPWWYKRTGTGVFSGTMVLYTAQTGGIKDTSLYKDTS